MHTDSFSDDQHLCSSGPAPGVATSILKHSMMMMKIKQGKFLALAHFKTK
jgi:hypothetical protein